MPKTLVKLWLLFLCEFTCALAVWSQPVLVGMWLGIYVYSGFTYAAFHHVLFFVSVILMIGNAYTNLFIQSVKDTAIRLEQVLNYANR